MDELIAEVKRAFDAQQLATLGKVWTTLQAILQEIKLARGDNTFNLLPLKKDTAAHARTYLSREFACSPEAWAAAAEALT